MFELIYFILIDLFNFFTPIFFVSFLELLRIAQTHLLFSFISFPQKMRWLFLFPLFMLHNSLFVIYDRAHNGTQKVTKMKMKNRNR